MTASSDAWSSLAELPLTIETYEFERLVAAVLLRPRAGDDADPPARRRRRRPGRGRLATTTPRRAPCTSRARCSRWSASGRWNPSATTSRGSTSGRCRAQWDVAKRWRNWAFESAALDLALAQAGRPLHDVLGREPVPVRFVNSLGLGDPPTFDPIRAAPRGPSRSALQARRDLAVAGVADRRGRGDRRGRDRRLQGPVRAGDGRAARDAGDVRARDRGLPGRAPRGRARPARGGRRCSPARATASPTTRRSTRSPTSTRRHWRPAR